MCFESVNGGLTNDRKNDLRRQAHAMIGDVSERFVDDAMAVVDKFEGYEFPTEIVSEGVVSSNSSWDTIAILEILSFIFFNVADWRA